MATCKSCGKSGFGFLEVKEGICPSCRKAAQLAEASKTTEQRQQETLQDKKVKDGPVAV